MAKGYNKKIQQFIILTIGVLIQNSGAKRILQAVTYGQPVLYANVPNSNVQDFNNVQSVPMDARQQVSVQQPNLQLISNNQSTVPVAVTNQGAPVAQNENQGMMRNLSNAIYNFNSVVDTLNNQNTSPQAQSFAQPSPRQMISLPQQNLSVQQPTQMYAQNQATNNQQQQPFRQAQIVNQVPQYYQPTQPIQPQVIQQQPMRQQVLQQQPQVQTVQAPQFQTTVPQVVDQRRVAINTPLQATPVNQIGDRVFPGVINTVSPVRTMAVATNSNSNQVIGNRVFPSVQNGVTMSVIGQN